MDILLLHGALGEAGTLKPVQELLSKYFVPHIIEFRGHGKMSKENEPFSLNGFCEDILEYCNDHGLDKIPVFGYSMGGYVALRLSITYPGLFTRIFTLGTKLKWDREIASNETLKLNPGKIMEKVPQFAQVLEKRHGPEWKGVVRRTSEFMTGLGNGEGLVLADYKRIPIPVRLAIGDQDNMVSLEETVEVFESLDFGSITVMNDTPHPLEMVSGEMLCQEILDFISVE